MDREKEAMARKRTTRPPESVDSKICANDSSSQSNLNIEARPIENVPNPEKKPESNHFLVNWSRRFFCVRQVLQEEDEVILYKPPSKP